MKNYTLHTDKFILEDLNKESICKCIYKMSGTSKSPLQWEEEGTTGNKYSLL